MPKKLKFFTKHAAIQGRTKSLSLFHFISQKTAKQGRDIAWCTYYNLGQGCTVVLCPEDNNMQFNVNNRGKEITKDLL